MVGVAMANYAAPVADAQRGTRPPGTSATGTVVFSGIKCDREGNLVDQQLIEAGEGEELPIGPSTSTRCAPTASTKLGGHVPQALFDQALVDNAPSPVFHRVDSAEITPRWNSSDASSHMAGEAAPARLLRAWASAS